MSRLLVAICALLSLALSPNTTLAQTPIGAPTIHSITPTEGQLHIAWTAPASVTAITAYDLRYIETSADETVDANWTEVEDIWEGSGDLTYSLSGITTLASYDLQVRAVTTSDGPWSSTRTGTPQIPAPVITSINTGDRALTVVWNEPIVILSNGALLIRGRPYSAYDLRYIESGTSDKADANWVVVEGFSASGALNGVLNGVLSGLSNGTGYDVQVRAVSETDGAWSATVTGTPAEHGHTAETASVLTLSIPLGGTVDPDTDADYFELALTSGIVVIRTSGDLDTHGELLDGNGEVLESSDDGGLPEDYHNFLIWRRITDPGTYFIKVTAEGGETGSYVLHASKEPPASSTNDAVQVSINSPILALLEQANDIDYFEFSLRESARVVVRTSGVRSSDTQLELLDSSRTRIAVNDYGLLPPGDEHARVQSQIAAGRYYIKVTSGFQGPRGPYEVHVNVVSEPGNTTADAAPLRLHQAGGGTIASASEEDYFRVDLEETTHILLRGVSETVDINGSLLDSAGQSMAANFYEETLLNGDAMAFTLRATLSAGTYYIKVTRSGGAETGAYTVLIVDDPVLERLFSRCSGISTAFGDPLYGCQWNLKNTGQLGGTPGEDINVEGVWTGGNLGAGIHVVLVDEGMDYQHEDLNTDESRSHRYVSEPYYSAYTHATNVAGIVAARDNNLGVRGVAPRATIIVHTSLVPGGRPGSHPTREAAAMIRNMEVAAVFNNSWSGTRGPAPAAAPQGWESAVKTGVTDGYAGKGVFYVFSAGNGGETGGNANLDEYVNHYHVTTVCAVNDLGERAAYSEVGANLWVCAPSNDRTRGRPGIFTTTNYSAYTAGFGGTSAAAPTVSGVAALVRAANTSLTWRDVKLILAASARKNDASNGGWEQGALQYGSSSEHYDFNHEYGFGVVDASTAVALAGTWTNLPPASEVTAEWDGASVVIPDLTDPNVPLGIAWTMNVGPDVEFTEFVEVTLKFAEVANRDDVPGFRELEVKLESPSGAVSVLAPAITDDTTCRFLGPCGLEGGFRFGSARHLGENPKGAWKLRIFDRVTGSTPGTLKSWSLTVYGHRSAPTAPVIESVAAGSESLTAAWTAPANTGASDIIAYDVRHIRSDAMDKADDEWTVVDNAWTSGDLDYTISRLTGSVQYDVQVRAVNAEGDGLWSETRTGMPTTDRAPNIDSITPRDRSITVQWTAPTNGTLGTITSYDLHYIRTDAPNKADANWTKVTGIWTSGTLGYTLDPTPRLINGVSYDVRLRALVGTDELPWSGERLATPRTTPGAPAIGSVTGGDGALPVEWSAPSSDGGDDITSYDLQYIKTSEDETAPANWDIETGVWSSGDLTAELTGLDTGTQYDVQVRAVNDAGEGAWSATVVGTTRPGAPAVDAVTGIKAGLTVEWSAPASDGDAAVSSYDLRYIKTSEDETVEANWTVRARVWTSGDRTATVTGLDVGTQYDLQVRAVNVSGAGPWSPTRMAATVPALSDLALSGVRLNPSFATGTTSYTALVGYTVEETTVTPSTSNTNSTIEYLDGDDSSLGTGATLQVDLSEGANVIKVKVTAQDGVATETYTITVTREEEDPSLTPQASDPVAAFPSTATYTIRFTGWWTRAVTPDGLPGGAHFSRLIGGVHNADVTFLEGGEMASAGVESMAEIGNTSTLKGEVNLARNADPPTALSVIEGSTNSIGRTATRTLSNRTLTTEFPRVTLTTMIAPSHDWFVGVSGLPLLDTSGLWLRSHAVDLFPWDAGTEEGDDFSLLPDVDTTPRGVITSISGTGKFTTERIASLTLTLQSVRTERSLVENTGAGVDIGAPVAAVAGSGTYTLGGTDARFFDLDTSTGQLRTKSGVTYDADTKDSYTVTVTETDTDGSVVTTVDIAIENIDERPVISGPAEMTIEEGGSLVDGTYEASDQEGATIVWQPLAGADRDAFEFNTSNGRLTFKTAPDFEDPDRSGDNTYEVTLGVTAGEDTVTLPVTVTVTNREEPGVLGLPPTRPQENAAYTATLSDPDVVQSTTWTWERSTSRSGGWSAVTGAADGTTTSVYTPATGDIGYYLRVTATYTDGHGPNKGREATSSSTVRAEPAANTPPTFTETNPARSVPENAGMNASVGSPVTATDSDPGDTVRHELDPVSDLFTIDNNGQIRVKTSRALNHETEPSHTVTVKASDSSNAFATVDVEITVEDVNEAPTAVRDTATTNEDTSVTIDVLSNDTDPENDDLTVTSVTRPSEGSATVNSDGTITYTPNANYHGSDSFTYRARDTGNLNSNVATVALTIDSVNDAPAFAAASVERSVSESADPGTEVRTPVTATDVDEGDSLTYSLSGTDAGSFDIGRDSGQIAVGAGVTFDIATKDTYELTVTASDSGTPPRSATADVTITVTAGPVRPLIIIGGGGGGGPSGPTPSEVDFEWTVKHDIEALDAGHDTPSGMWSDGATLWLLQNGTGADDAIYAYDLDTGQRDDDRDFDLDERNRAPRGVWSDRTVIWISDSGQEKLFAHDLESGERLPDRDLVLAARNGDARGIWSDGETMWVLDGGKDSLFAYDLSSGDLLAEYDLDSANGDPHGIWSDGVGVWVSDHGAKRLLAYRLPTLPNEDDRSDEDQALERVRDEDFKELSKAGNNSPRGTWFDGAVMYVADANDGKVYSYNMPNAIDARLASLELSGVNFGEFSPLWYSYASDTIPNGDIATLTATPAQPRASLLIDPPDHDGYDANGYHVRLLPGLEITITVTSEDGSRERVYRLLLGEEEADGPAPDCLRGAVAVGFSLVVYEGGTAEELVACALTRDVTALYALHEGVYVSYILGAPDFVNSAFIELFADGVPSLTPLTAASTTPSAGAPRGAGEEAAAESWPECLRGDIAEGFSLVLYEGGEVEELTACARSSNVTAVYALHGGEFVSYIFGAPEFVNQSFLELFAEGLPSFTPLVAKK